MKIVCFDVIEDILTGLQNNTIVDAELKLNSSVHYEPLVTALKTNTSLQFLKISTACTTNENTRTRSGGLIKILQALENHSSLKSLDLSGVVTPCHEYSSLSGHGAPLEWQRETVLNQINSQLTPSIAQLLKTVGTLHTLNLAYNQMQNEHVILILKALQNSKLHTLDLNYNKLSSEQAIALLVSYLDGNASLRRLNLSHSDISDVGILSIARTLAKNRSLSELNLDEINFNSQGMQAISAFLKENTSLRKLTLNQIGNKDHPQLSSQDIYLLLTSLRANKSLAVLHINNIALTDLVGNYAANNKLNTTLLHTLQENNSLVDIQFSGSIEHRGSEIARLLQMNNDYQLQLLKACELNNGEEVTRLLKLGVSPDAGYNNKGATPLIMATLYGHVGIVKLLLKADADPDLTNQYKQTPLMIAQEKGYKNIVQLLQTVLIPINRHSPAVAISKTAIQIPAKFCCPITHLIMLEPVIAADSQTYEKEAIIEWIEKQGTSPLTQKTISKELLIPNQYVKSDIQEFLEKNIANIDPRDIYLPKFFIAQLEQVIIEDKQEQLKQLLKQDPRLLTKEITGGRTALHVACESGSLAGIDIIVQALGEQLSDILKIPKPMNWRPTILNQGLIQATLQNNKNDLIRFLEFGADINAEDSQGYTALDYALENDRQEIAMILIEYRLKAENIDSSYPPTQQYAYLSVKIAREQIKRSQQKIANLGMMPPIDSIKPKSIDDNQTIAQNDKGVIEAKQATQFGIFKQQKSSIVSKDDTDIEEKDAHQNK